jgi:predicted metalloprotease with PDZ domain
MSTSTEQSNLSLHYNISIEPKLREIAVTLKIKGAKERLVFAMRQSWGPQTEYLSNVKMLQVFDSKGSQISIEQIPAQHEQNKWRIQNVSPEMTLSYLIHPKADKLISWEPTLNESYCLLLGYGIFVYPDLNWDQELSCEVVLNAPSQWLDITTWAHQKRRYHVSTLGTLIESAIGLGDYRLYHSTLEEKALILAIRSQWPFSDRELLSWTENYLLNHAEIFGGFPFDVLTVFYDKRQCQGGLGTIAGCGAKKSAVFALINPEHDDRPNVMGINHYIISHELFHLWLGGAILIQEPELLWFMEGIPHYYGTLTSHRFLSNTETESQSRFLESLREWWVKEKEITGLSLERAVFAGDSERNYELIYNRGALVGWMLDVEIRAATRNQKGLADLMKILYQHFGNRACSTEDVFALASELGGQNYVWIYKNYVLCTEPIPFENYLAKANALKG